MRFEEDFFDSGFVSAREMLVAWVFGSWIQNALDLGPKIIESFGWQIVKRIGVDEKAEGVSEHASVHLQLKERALFFVGRASSSELLSEGRLFKIDSRKQGFISDLT